MKAYKATDKNMQCRGFQFEMSTEFTYDGEIEMCYSGFHFCKDLNDIFNYYNFAPTHRFFEVEISDDAEVIHGGDKSVTHKIKFIRELSFVDIKELTNSEFYVNEDGGYVEFDRTAFYNEHGKYHRLDGPALIHANGDKFWFQNGKLHREDGPAVVYANGDQYWYQNGKLHREDGPAIVYANGDQYWYQNGELHRVDGPAVIYTNNDCAWYQNNKLHRIDGPAVIRANGGQEWYQNGELKF